ncbi:MAG: hypothetical protein RLZZ393_1026 [Pseudomonadota bacterium]|jgi:uncharacterized protein YyaL (SSP411 family)
MLADTSVRWFRWGDEAFELACRENRPLLLHIGYEGCAGSTAMRQGAFADAGTLATLQAHFVPVYVDRDESPEIDRLMQLSHRLLTREDGGWPLNMFLTQDEGLPFFGTGYLPAVASHGQPGCVDVLRRVAGYYSSQRDALREQGDALRDTLRRIDGGSWEESTMPGTAALRATREALEAGFDREHGGWGRSPKFPQVLAIRHLLRHWQGSAGGETPDLKALYLATLALTRMAEGGLHDAVSGGFFRYCRDEAWRDPLPEKSLLDNALLLETFAEAAVLTGDPSFRRIANSTADCLLNAFQLAGGGFRANLATTIEGGAVLHLAPNAAAVRALATAAGLLGRADLKSAAADTLDLLRQAEPASLEEHAMLADAILQRSALEGEDADLPWARRLADAMLSGFEDRPRGGFHALPATGMRLFHRARVFADGATASGNALAARVMLRLDREQPDSRYRQAAERTLRAAARRMETQPLAHLGLIAALADLLADTQ